jgi:hypothetical protein
MFDSDYLRHLFQYSYDLASSGIAWHKALPGEIRVVPPAPEDASPLK